MSPLESENISDDTTAVIHMVYSPPEPVTKPKTRKKEKI